MKTATQLWVRLKVIDLVTQTARITLAEKLDFGDRLSGMTHYWYWAMDAEGESSEKAIAAEVDRVIRLDSAFTNQNKHSYRLAAGGAALGDLALERDYAVSGGPAAGAGTAAGVAPAARGRASAGGATAGGGLFAFDCLVREKRPDREAAFAERLNARLRGVVVSNMKCGELWRLITAAPSREAALADVEKMLVSRSRREGLLLNPHYQQYEIIDSRRIETGPSGADARAGE